MSLNRRVLLLNASYEALGVVAAARAVRLVWKGAAQPVEYTGGCVLRSQHYAFIVPSVVRLVEYIDLRRRRAQSGKQRIHILVRDKMRCQYCGVRGTIFDLTLDHIMPRSRGGRFEPENLCAACKPCNQRKGPHARRGAHASARHAERPALRPRPCVAPALRRPPPGLAAFPL